MQGLKGKINASANCMTVVVCNLQELVQGKKDFDANNCNLLPVQAS